MCNPEAQEGKSLVCPPASSLQGNRASCKWFSSCDDRSKQVRLGAAGRREICSERLAGMLAERCRFLCLVRDTISPSMYLYAMRAIMSSPSWTKSVVSHANAPSFIRPAHSLNTIRNIAKKPSRIFSTSVTSGLTGSPALARNLS